MVPEIARIYAKPGYPKHHPNTVVPEYPAAMHAKYELVQLTIRNNPFRTKYFCWQDIGLFRENEQEDSPRFSLTLPIGFQMDSVAYNEVYRRNSKASVKDIISRNMVWVCGCFFIGEATVMFRWTEEYKVSCSQLTGT